MSRFMITVVVCASVTLAVGRANAADDVPRAFDPRLIVERVASAPDIVQPVGIACDSRGRLLVIESHTHFRPKDYRGPKHDRVRLLDLNPGDRGKPRFTTFFEGTRATMDIAIHPDGSVYLATRNEILRLQDSSGSGTADRKRRLIFLDTKGDYPHNGLSGLAFDSKGNLYFGMGENIGEDYKLVGADGTTLTGGGEGGNIFWCTADGKKLRRVATGFWNPFGICTDIFGRVFAVDNDPDAMPPCRLLHVVEGGDYGYQYRYGRSGRHPFQSWNGQLPGTLPMASGTGEAPCEILSYESDGLPAEYLGNLLVASWADHRIERYVVKEHGASVLAERQPFIQGGKDFRPVGIAVAPDGALYVSDWVLSDYNLHGKGAIWHIRQRQVGKPKRPTDVRRALSSRHRPLRERAAAELAGDGGQGRAFLRDKATSGDVRVRAVALTALIDASDDQTDLTKIATQDPEPALRALAVRGLLARRADVAKFVNEKEPPAVRFEAIAAVTEKSALLQLLTDPDPFLRHAAVERLAHLPALLKNTNAASLTDRQERIGFLLALRKSGRSEPVRLLQFLDDPDPDIRLLAVKWIADEKLSAFRGALVAGLRNPHLNSRLYTAYATALARMDNRDVSEGSMADYFFARLTDRMTSSDQRIAALRVVPSSHAKLTIDVLSRLLTEKDTDLQREAVRALIEHPSPKRRSALLRIVQDEKYADAIRAEAIVGLEPEPGAALDALLSLSSGMNAELRNEALRSLTGAKLDRSQRMLLEIGAHRPGARSLTSRVLGQPLSKGRPSVQDVDAWLKRLEGPADPVAGRRVFFHPRLAGCFRCHRVDGRGQDVGPDLSVIGRTERRHILDSILQPNNLVAPHFQVWTIITHAGKIHTGLLHRTNLDEYTYIDAQGKPFKLNTRDIAETRPAPGSLMPSGLIEMLTDQELRDLLAYLESRRP